MTGSNSKLNNSNSSKGFFRVLAAPFAPFVRIFHPISPAEIQQTLDESANTIKSAEQAQAESEEVLKRIDTELLLSRPKNR